MYRNRVIPVLLLKDQGLVKTVRFREPTYLGDPINAIRIFNDKEVDELVFLDIAATLGRRPPSFDMVRRIASECFMPLCYGGGIRTLDHVIELFNLGVEKVALNMIAFEDPTLVTRAAAIGGSQSVVVSIDVKQRMWDGRRVVVANGTKSVHKNAVAYARKMEDAGAGEILLNSVDRDGTMSGYDLDLIQSVSSAVSIPVIACGGAGKLDDFAKAIKAGASAAAAGSLFVFSGRHRAVLISYPSPEELASVLSEAS